MLGVAPGDAEAHHTASGYRYNVLEGLIKKSGDSDIELPRWAKDGAPMGIDETIAPGGHFPLQDPKDDMTMEDLMQFEAENKTTSNHGSFSELHGQDIAPGVELVGQHLEQGFGLLFKTREDTEEWLGKSAFPAPLATFRSSSQMGLRSIVLFKTCGPTG